MKEILVKVTIHDCEVQTFRAGGKGGQNQNKVESGVRVIHKPSKARGESRETRNQHENKKRAFLRMIDTPQFKAWIKLETAKALGQPSLESIVEEQMKQIRVEYKEDGKWVETQIPA